MTDFVGDDVPERPTEQHPRERGRTAVRAIPSKSSIPSNCYSEVERPRLPNSGRDEVAVANVA